MVLTKSFSILPMNEQQSMRGARCSKLQSSLKAKQEGPEKKHHTMANQIGIQLKSSFLDVCGLHMGLTNKGFQNGCWPMEDMVHIWSAMTN